MDRKELYSRDSHELYMKYIREYFTPKQLEIKFNEESNEEKRD